MADVFAVSLRAFSDDPENPLLKTIAMSENGTMPLSTEIGAGTTGLLSLLTVIGTSLSIVGVVLAFITYSLFSDLRTVSGTSLLNLLAALFLAHLVLVVGVERTADNNLCLAVGFLLHYLWISVHCWLAVMYKDMYSTFRDNINLQPSPAAEKSKSFMKCALFAWGFPAACISAAALIHFYTNVDRGTLISPTCWILGKGSMVYTFIIPFVMLAIVEIWYFVKSAVVIRYTSSLQVTPKSRDKMRRRRYLQLFLYAKMTLLLLVTWICCLVAEFAPSIVFWFAFTILISIQGFVVSLAYCCNSRVFRLYSKSFRTTSGKPSGYGSSELSRSTSLALLTWQPTPDAV